jgi:hypothetical protein
MKQGKWIYDPNGLKDGLGCWKCGKCGSNNYNIAPIQGIDPLICIGSTFCPSCGERMDGKATGDNAPQPINEMGGVTMEKLETVQTQGKLNEVYRVGEEGPGGAYHTYAIVKIDPEEGENPIIATVKFQKGPRSEKTSRHGILDHELVEIVRDRLKAFQKGEYATEENRIALFLLEEALKWMNKRVENRIKRGVFGTKKK